MSGTKWVVAMYDGGHTAHCAFQADESMIIMLRDCAKAYTNNPEYFRLLDEFERKVSEGDLWTLDETLTEMSDEAWFSILLL